MIMAGICCGSTTCSIRTDSARASAATNRKAGQA
jgi:hypothetical protein